MLVGIGVAKTGNEFPVLSAASPNAFRKRLADKDLRKAILFVPVTGTNTGTNDPHDRYRSGSPHRCPCHAGQF